ncbi:tripartite tricarboxylate transporter TctB family protein [Salipiger mucosus]|uniref:DUF1468 domain-containing protein n=1 Tax=Salipiger mucosus DSM 16094 TaxID=1123237 RepID=S9Q9J5_9RHOB|nr:tripartite tricarboxylate transporter TctB family protein [Salipiger mucosus]EPX76637.1 hypothetical protein Salmuc_00469 [Salipiger mucosus DSM 16094]
MPRHLQRELLIIALMLLLLAAFAFWYVPLSIDVPAGFGSDSEVSPRFAPYLLAAIMALATILRILSLALAWAKGGLDEMTDDISEDLGTPDETRNGIFMNLLTNFYAFVLIPVAGFYLASIALVAYLVRRLGEQRPWMVALTGVACAVFVYLLFGRLLSVRLPGGLLGDLLD